MTFTEAKERCHVRSAIYSKSVGRRYWKNHPDQLDDQVPDSQKQLTDWAEHDPRDSDSGSLASFND